MSPNFSFCFWMSHPVDKRRVIWGITEVNSIVAKDVWKCCKKGFINNIARRAYHASLFVMKTSDFFFQIHDISSVSPNVSCTSCSSSSFLYCFHHRFDYFRMLAHSKIIIWAPNSNFFFFPIFKSSDSFWKFILLSLNINKLSISSFLFHWFHVFSKHSVIIKTLNFLFFCMLLS